MGVRTLYNILFTFFFVLTAPYYFLRMWRRGNWRARFPGTFRDLQPEPQAGADQPPSHLAPCRQCRRSQSMHAIHPRPGAAHAQHQIRRVHDHHHRHGPVAASICPGTSAKFTTPSTGGRASRRAFDTINPEAIVLFEAEIWPNFLWRAQRPARSLVSGQRPVVQSILSRLPAVRVPVSPAVQFLRRCLRPKRSRCRTFAGSRLPARSRASRGQSEV